MRERRVDVWWGPEEDESAAGVTAAEIDDLLDRLHGHASAAPFLVDLVDDSGAVLTIGLGQAVTVLNFQASLDPPYFATYVEDPAVDDTVWFDYGGHESEFTPDTLIPSELGRLVARSFVESGDRSAVQWQEV